MLSQNEDPLVNYIDTISLTQTIEPFIHQKLTTLLREYMLIGGMPSVVKHFRETRSFLECQTFLASLLETYRADFPKYASKTQNKYLQLLFEKAPELRTRHFKYTHVSQDIRSADLKNALEQLTFAGLIQKIVMTQASGIPLNYLAKENRFKLLFLDIGLVNSANKLNFQTIWETDLLQINEGALAEQFVGQELLAYEDPYIQPKLFYWERDKKGAMAEVDYVIQQDQLIVPIEVKAGKTGSLRSLHLFLAEKNQPFGVRFSLHPLSFHDQILSIPLYLINQLPRLIKECTKMYTHSG